MRFLSVCSGIEAASVAWGPLGWQAVAFSEIDPFPCAVLAHHYPDVPNLGDMTKWEAWPDAAFDVLVGGTPCQSFSVAGLRQGLRDPRGNLALVYLAIAERYRPRWLVWENVPGVLSSSDGRDFGAFLGALGALGYGWSYRVLDAQFFGLAQRRKRVFVVGHLGGWTGAAAVLLEPESLSGNPSPRREAGQRVAGTVEAGLSRRCGQPNDHDPAGGLIAFGGNDTRGPIDVATARNAHHSRHDFESETFVTHALTASSGVTEDGSGRETPLVPVSVGLGSDPLYGIDVAQPVTNRNGDPGVVAFTSKDHGTNAGGQVAVAHFQDSQFGAKEYDTAAIRAGRIPEHSMVVSPLASVRRLTPRECERLQGFPDDYTLVPYRNKPAADGPRYKALGNSMAVPVVRWIGERIAMVDAILQEAA